jgi:hypothetical protein
MLLAAAAVLFATAAAPALMHRGAEERAAARGGAPAPRPRAGREEGIVAAVQLIRSHPYVRRLAALVLVSTVALTFADLVFKATVAQGVAPDQLAWVFAFVYMVVNVLSLVVQLAFVGWATRTLSIDRVLSCLPALLLAVSAWFLAGGGLLAAMALKGVDGTLRHSLHRTASEVLSVPLPAEIRQRLKAFIDVIGQRGGQALASLAFLALAGLGMVGSAGGADLALGGVLVALCVTWIALAAGIKRHYFDLFRTALDEGAIRTRIEFPDLDLASLETLIAALSSPDENEVVAALDLLAEKGRVRLVPGLILYHPSPRVVVRAIELFEADGRADHRRLRDLLLERPEAEVRTAALLASRPGDVERAVLERALADPSPDVRATALVGLYCCSDVHPRIPSILETLMQAGSSEAKQALARAIARRPDKRFDGLLISLAAQGDPAVGREVARAMRMAPSARHLESLRSLLARRDSREEARRSLVVLGKEAEGFLAGSLSDETLPGAVRRHLPRTLARFDPPAVGPVLLMRLAEEPDGAVRFKILRALGHLRARQPGLALDHAVLDDAIERTLETVFRLLDWRVAIARSHAAGDGRQNAAPAATPVRALIEELLRHKEEHAVERLFRLFSLRYPREDFKRIHRGIGSRDPKTRASGRELLESVLRSPLRDAVVGVLDDVPDEERLAAGRRYHRAGPASRRDLLRTLLEQGSVPLRCLVAYHVAELGMKELRDDLADLCDAAVGAMEETFRNALDMLDDPRKEKAFVVPVR